MDEEERVSDVRRRRSSAEVAALVSKYERSGMRRMEFCREHGLSLSTLARYQRRRPQASSPSAGGWVAVEISGAEAVGAGGASHLVVVTNRGSRIEIGVGFDVRTLRRLLSVLEQA